MQRKTPLKRTALKRKSRKHDVPQIRREFAAQQSRCAACGSSRDLHVHHILGGRVGRPDDRRNLLRLCRTCHGLTHGDRLRGASGDFRSGLSLANILWLKQESDPQWYDLNWLQQTNGKLRLPDPIPPPHAPTQ